MTKRHLFVIDPIDKINPSTDSSYDVMLECQSRGDEVWITTIQSLYLKGGLGHAHVRKVKIKEPSNSAEPIFELLSDEKRNFADFRLVWMRKDPPVDENFIAALHVLSSHKKADTLVVNEPEGLLIANEKLWPVAHAADFMPPTIVSSDPKILAEAASEFEKVVVKPLFESGGSGVMAFERGNKNLKSALDLLTQQGRRPAMLQRFIEGAELGDKRIILIGGKPVGAVLRVPGSDDYRANLHVGGTATKTTITDREREICKHLEPHLIAYGLYWAGIDVINGYLTEVNVTSPTGLQEIDRLNQNSGNTRIRAQLLNWIEENLL